jgi:hypothetical protein
MKVCSGFIWLKIRTSSGVLWTRQWTFGFCQRRGILWLNEWPSPSQEGFSCTKAPLLLHWRLMSWEGNTARNRFPTQFCRLVSDIYNFLCVFCEQLLRMLPQTHTSHPARTYAAKHKHIRTDISDSRFNHSNHSGNYTNHLTGANALHSVHTVYLCVLTINNDCFPKQH